MKDFELIEHVKLALNPKLKTWVLFSNGTVVVLDNITNESLEEQALEYMKKFGPVHVGSEAGDFAVVDAHTTEGWLVTGYGAGMYTYVHPQELKSNTPDDLQIGIYGRSKRHEDSEALKIIYIKDTRTSNNYR